MLENEQKLDNLTSTQEIELVHKMVGTDFNLWKEYWGEEHTIDMYYFAHPERHPLAKYVSHLIEDLHEITEKYKLEELLDKFGYYYDDNTEGYYSEEDEFVITLQELTGIDKDYLPPKDKICPCHVVDLSAELDRFLGHFEIFINTPNCIAEFNYLVVREYWDKPLPIGNGFNDFTWEDEVDENIDNW